MVNLSSGSNSFVVPNGFPAMAMKGGCSMLMLCLAAIALMTFGVSIMSVGFPASSVAFRSNILTNILPSSFSSSSSSTRTPLSSPLPPVRPSPPPPPPPVRPSPLLSNGGLAIDTQHHSLHSAGECDLWSGRWVADKQGEVLYTNNSCPILTPTQNCEGNGRPDKGYVKWRWRPHGCELPRFDVHLFFWLLRGKTLAFVGDSVARNHMEALMCILWQEKRHGVDNTIDKLFD